MATHLYCTYRERYVSGGEALSDDEWCSYSDEYIEYILDNVSISEPQNPYNELVEVGKFIKNKWVQQNVSNRDDVWVVIVEYHDGGTFKMTHGYGAIACICVDEKSALKAKDKILNEGWTGVHSYASWSGYFAGIEDIRLKRVFVFS